MSKDKYPSISSCQMDATVFNILQIFFATRAVLKIGKYPRIFPSSVYLGNIRSRDAFRPIARERKYLMDYKPGYATLICALINLFPSLTIFNFLPFLTY